MPRDALSSLKRLEAALRRRLARKPGSLRRRLLVLGRRSGSAGRRLRGRGPLAALGPAAARAHQCGPRVPAARLRRGDLVLAGARHDPEPADPRQRPERPVDHPPGRRAGRLLDPRPRAAHVSGGAPSRGRPDLLPPQQAGARRRADRGCLRPSARSGLRRSAAAVASRSRAPSSKATPGASTSAGSSSTTSTTSGSTRFTTAASPASREASFCARGCSRASDPRACASKAADCASEMRPRRSPSSAPCRERSSRSSRPSCTDSEVWQKVTGDVSFDAGFERLASLQYLAGPPAGTRLADGPGAEPFAAPSSTGSRRENVRLGVQDGTVGLRELTLHGNADLRLRIPRWNLVSGPLEISGSRLALSDVRSSGPDESRRGGAGSTCVPARSARRRRRPSRPTTRDARPLLALFSAELPAWTRGLVDLDDFTATATVDAGPSLTRVRDLDARGGNFRVQGHYVRRNADREGAFLIESGALSLGLEVEQERDEAPAARREAVVRRTARRRGARATTRRPRRTTRRSLARPSSERETPGGWSRRPGIVGSRTTRLIGARPVLSSREPSATHRAVASRASVHGSVAPSALPFQSRSSSGSTSSNFFPAYSARPADSHPKRYAGSYSEYSLPDL